MIFPLIPEKKSTFVLKCALLYIKKEYDVTISIIQPPVRDFYQTPHRHAALGANTVKSILETAGHKVNLYNFPLWENRVSTPPLPRELSYLKPFLIPGETGPVSWFTQRKHFGPSFEECARIVLKSNPDLVMISCFAWGYAQEALQTAIAIKRQSPHTLLEIGGAGVSVNPGWFEKTGLFRHVRTGPAEENLRGFFGLTEPLPPIMPVIAETTEYRGKPQYAAMLTRGCPARCSFCANYLTLGREFRKVPPEEILDQLERTGRKDFHLNLEDDNLLSDKKYFLDFLAEFKSRFPHATLSAENGLDYQKLTVPLAETLIDSGFTRFNLSMASSDSRILAAQKRSSRLDHLTELLNHLAERGIPAVTYFIAGLPGDTPKSVLANLLFLSRVPTEIGISPFYAVPGLPGFEHPGEKDLPESPVYYCGSSVYPWNGNLSTAQLITAFRLSRLTNLIKRVRAVRDADLSSPQPSSHQLTLHRELVERIFETRRLYSITGKGKTRQIIPVPEMDNDMVESFFTANQTVR